MLTGAKHTVDDQQVDAVLAASQVLVGIAARSLVDLEADGVTLPQFRALVLMCEHGPTTMSSLAQQLGVRPSSCTRAVDRLRRAGLCRRTTGRTDRREVLVSPTSAGLKLVGRVLAERRAQIVALLRPMPAVQRAAVGRGLGLLAAAAGEVPGDAWRLGWPVANEPAGQAAP